MQLPLSSPVKSTKYPSRFFPRQADTGDHLEQSAFTYIHTHTPLSGQMFMKNHDPSAIIRHTISKEKNHENKVH